MDIECLTNGLDLRSTYVKGNFLLVPWFDGLEIIFHKEENSENMDKECLTYRIDYEESLCLLEFFIGS
jgi:hypothetical protein